MEVIGNMGQVILWILRFLSVLTAYAFTPLLNCDKTMHLVIDVAFIVWFLLYFKCFRIPVLGPLLKIYMGIAGGFWLSLLIEMLIEKLILSKTSYDTAIFLMIAICAGTILFSILISVFVFQTTDKAGMVTLTTQRKRKLRAEKKTGNLMDLCNQKFQNLENLVNALSEKAAQFAAVDQQTYQNLLQETATHKEQLTASSFCDDTAIIGLICRIDISTKCAMELLNGKHTQNHNSGSDSAGAANASGSSDFFAGCKTREDTEKVYRNLAKIYHPDNATGVNEIFLKINEEYQEKLKSFR